MFHLSGKAGVSTSARTRAEDPGLGGVADRGRDRQSCRGGAASSSPFGLRYRGPY